MSLTSLKEKFIILYKQQAEKKAINTIKIWNSEIHLALGSCSLHDMLMFLLKSMNEFLPSTRISCYSGETPGCQFVDKWKKINRN